MPVSGSSAVLRFDLYRDSTPPGAPGPSGYIGLWLHKLAAADGLAWTGLFDGAAGDQAFASITRAGARPIRETAFGFIWVVTDEQPGLAGRLAREGAIGAYRDLPLSPTIAGCFALADAKMANLWAP